LGARSSVDDEIQISFDEDRSDEMDGHDVVVVDDIFTPPLELLPLISRRSVSPFLYIPASWSDR
jgi:hypothetical protein